MINRFKSGSKPIALTAGEPSSIAAELLFKAWLQLKNQKNLSFFTINNLSCLESIKKELNYKAVDFAEISHPAQATTIFNTKIPVINIPLLNSYTKTTTLFQKELATGYKIIKQASNKVILGTPNLNHVAFVLQSLNKALEYAFAKEVNAITTMPIEKYIMQRGGFNFIGHTEYLAFKSNTTHPVMLLASPNSNLRVVPIKIHLSLKQSIASLTKENIIDTIKIVWQDLSSYLKKNIAIAVLGLNPHAGEQGLMGKEEETIIKPALATLKKIGIETVGPLPADTAFSKNNINKFDVIIGMYHDQVLTPFKALLFDQGVNITLGLPFLRTSPDHGTALDIAKKNIANPGSIIAAIKLANLWQYN